METHLRSVVKGMSWRAVGTIDTMILVFIFSGEILLAASIGITELVTKIFLYWAHERIWQKVGWGLKSSPATSP
jgi:uncharacterized membrane protein